VRAVPWRYALTNALLVAFIAALAYGGWLIWAVAGLAILIGGLIDEAVGDEHERIGGERPLFFDVNLHATLPLLMIVTFLLFQATVVGGSPVIAATIGAGYFYALAGVTVAHELTHRVTSPLSLVSARALLAFTINPTFETYHINGHHRNVGTYHDPATARRGEYVLAFVARTVVGQSVAGWLLETERLRRKGPSRWSCHNRVLGGIFCSLVIVAVAAMTAGVAGMLVFLAAAVFGRIIHEMVNYVQHYGLVRADGASIETRHAWDSSRLISNALHYNLPRHADHHMFASKPLWELDIAANSPRLPCGYQTMSLITLYPPAWHRAMDPLLADWDRRLANDVERSLVRERGWTVVVTAPNHAAKALAPADGKPEITHIRGEPERWNGGLELPHSLPGPTHGLANAGDDNVR
jgi:fatty acid desaturase